MSSSIATPVDITYQTWDDVKNKWLPNVVGKSDYADIYAGIFGHDVCAVYANLAEGSCVYRVHTKGGKWLSQVTNRQDYAGIFNKPIDAFMIKSTDPNIKIYYRVHLRGGNWLSWVSGYDTNNSSTGYAGSIGKPIDGIQMYAEKTKTAEYEHTFTTGNSNIVGKILISDTREATSYSVKCELYFRRTNTNTGTATNGNLTYTTKIGGTTINDKVKKYFKVENSKEWCYFGSWSKSFNLGALESTTYKVGFSSSDSSGKSITAFKNNTESVAITVPRYAQPNEAPTIKVDNLGTNRCKITSTLNKKGDGNTISKCRVYYTIDGTDPSPTNHKGYKEVNLNAKKTDSFEVSVTSKTQIRAVGYTIGTYNSTKYGEKSSIKAATIPYYASPTMGSVGISYHNKSIPTTKATYKASWSATKANNESPIEGYKYTIKIGSTTIVTSTTTSTSLNISDILSTKKIKLKVGDKITVTVKAFAKNGANTELDSSAKSSTITVVASGTMFIKVSGKWVEGQVFVKTNGKWKESLDVYLRKSSDWKQSI
jgi:hypothetical protein